MYHSITTVFYEVHWSITVSAGFALDMRPPYAMIVWKRIILIPWLYGHILWYIFFEIMWNIMGNPYFLEMYHGITIVLFEILQSTMVNHMFRTCTVILA